MEKQAIYKDKARYYDLIYSWKDYKKEAQKVRSLVKKYKKSPGNDLLEVACGTGKHAQYLKAYFSILGADLNKGMLAIARKNVKGVPFKQADMLRLNLGKKFDVILCLFSSIGHMKTPANLRKAIRNFSKHLKKGGVVIIEPWIAKSAFRVGIPYMTVHKSPTIDVARLHVSERKGDVALMDMHYLVAEKGKKVLHFVDRQELGLFEVGDTLRFMREAGLQARHLNDGLWRVKRGLYVGIKK